MTNTHTTKHTHCIDTYSEDVEGAGKPSLKLRDFRAQPVLAPLLGFDLQ